MTCAIHTRSPIGSLPNVRDTPISEAIRSTVIRALAPAMMEFGEEIDSTIESSIKQNSYS
jgi:hypothetical protein